MRSLRSQFHRLALKAGAKAETRGFDSLNEKEVVVRCIDLFESQVSSAGFKSFFWNSSGDRAAETVAVLNRVGASETANLLTEAMEIFPDAQAPTHPLVRQRLIMNAGPRRLDALKRLDHQFNQGEEDLQALAVAYVLSLPD